MYEKYVKCLTEENAKRQEKERRLTLPERYADVGEDEREGRSGQGEVMNLCKNRRLRNDTVQTAPHSSRQQLLLQPFRSSSAAVRWTSWSVADSSMEMANER